MLVSSNLNHDRSEVKGSVHHSSVQIYKVLAFSLPFSKNRKIIPCAWDHFKSVTAGRIHGQGSFFYATA